MLSVCTIFVLKNKHDMRRIVVLMLLSFVAMTAAPQVATKADALIGSWSGKLNVGAMSLTIVINFEQADGYVKCSIDSPDQGAKGIPIKKEYLSEDSVSLNVETIHATYRARVEGEKMVGTFTQNGMSMPLTLSKGERVRPIKRPQNPVEPYPYKTQEVTFYNNADHATLVGTLTYPVGFETMKRGKVPVVIMVTGSGLENRDEEIFQHKPFLVIADYLARHGIASLRYDDRGIGASSGGDRMEAEATTLDYKRDAEAGIEFLRSMKQFGKIGVIGHSEGGNVAFMLGASKSVDFVVSLAGVGVKADSALTAQSNRILELQGQSIKLSVAMFRLNAMAANNPWLRWFIDYDPTPDIAATRCPVLAVNGDKDCQVISQLNLSGIRKALPKNKKTVIKEYPSLNHLFQHCQTGLVDEYGDIEETFSPEVLNDIAVWIGGLNAK